MYDKKLLDAFRSSVSYANAVVSEYVTKENIGAVLSFNAVRGHFIGKFMIKPKTGTKDGELTVIMTRTGLRYEFTDENLSRIYKKLSSICKIYSYSVEARNGYISAIECCITDVSGMDEYIKTGAAEPLEKAFMISTEIWDTVNQYFYEKYNMAAGKFGISGAKAQFSLFNAGDEDANEDKPTYSYNEAASLKDSLNEKEGAYVTDIVASSIYNDQKEEDFYIREMQVEVYNFNKFFSAIGIM